MLFEQLSLNKHYSRVPDGVRRNLLGAQYRIIIIVISPSVSVSRFQLENSPESI